MDAANPYSHFGACRSDVAELVPAAAMRILDVGCGEGTLGEVLNLDLFSRQLEPILVSTQKSRG